MNANALTRNYRINSPTGDSEVGEGRREHSRKNRTRLPRVDYALRRNAMPCHILCHTLRSLSALPLNRGPGTDCKAQQSPSMFTSNRGWMDLGSACVRSTPMRSSEDGIGLHHSLAAAPSLAQPFSLLLMPRSHRPRVQSTLAFSSNSFFTAPPSAQGPGAMSFPARPQRAGVPGTTDRGTLFLRKGPRAMVVSSRVERIIGKLPRDSPLNEPHKT